MRRRGVRAMRHEMQRALPTHQVSRLLLSPWLGITIAKTVSASTDWQSPQHATVGGVE